MRPLLILYQSVSEKFQVPHPRCPAHTGSPCGWCLWPKHHDCPGFLFVKENTIYTILWKPSLRGFWSYLVPDVLSKSKYYIIIFSADHNSGGLIHPRHHHLDFSDRGSDGQKPGKRLTQKLHFQQNKARKSDHFRCYKFPTLEVGAVLKISTQVSLKITAYGLTKVKFGRWHGWSVADRGRCFGRNVLFMCFCCGLDMLGSINCLAIVL